jgi:hypothetical protein
MRRPPADELTERLYAAIGLARFEEIDRRSLALLLRLGIQPSFEAPSWITLGVPTPGGGPPWLDVIAFDKKSFFELANRLVRDRTADVGRLVHRERHAVPADAWRAFRGQTEGIDLLRLHEEPPRACDGVTFLLETASLEQAPRRLTLWQPVRGSREGHAVAATVALVEATCSPATCACIRHPGLLSDG